MSALTALVAWQGSRRLGQDVLRHAAFAVVGVATIQALLLLAVLVGSAVPRPLLCTPDYASAAVIGWAFFRQRRAVFLVSAFDVRHVGRVHT